MSADTAFVVNPAAGHGSGARVWRKLASRLSGTPLSYTVTFTTGPNEATALARKALGEGARTVVAVGGDGTAHEVVTGFFDQGHSVAPDARVAFVAAGTGNDVGRQFQLRDPTRLDQTATSVDILHLCFSGPNAERPESYALFHAGVGLAAEAVEMSNRVKRRLGWLAYAGGTAVALYRHRPRTVRFACDGGPLVSQELSFVFAANGRYAGGGMLIAPMASMEDGLLDVITLQGASRSEMLFRLLPAVYRGAHIGNPAVGHRQAHTVELDADQSLAVQVDGELDGTTPVRISVLPRALAVCR